jgi:hypothetical protein
MTDLKTIVEIVEADGELLLDLGTELCDRLGWQVGDTIEWKDNGDGSWQLINLTTAGSQKP